MIFAHQGRKEESMQAAIQNLIQYVMEGFAEKPETAEAFHVEMDVHTFKEVRATVRNEGKTVHWASGRRSIVATTCPKLQEHLRALGIRPDPSIDAAKLLSEHRPNVSVPIQDKGIACGIAFCY